MEDHIDQDVVDADCLAELTPAARAKVCDMIEYWWSEED
jgi:hypothetical protein